jgi:hypothetical protein
VPEGLILHHASVSLDERTWMNAVPITSVRRTLTDCAVDGLAPDVLRQAARQAVRRGLVTKPDLTEVDKALKQFGGING